jgi:predicted ester cyclase
MSVQQNKVLARRVFDEIWSEGQLDVADELLSPDFVGRPGGLGEPFHGPAGAKEFIGRLREGFPDITFTIEDMIGEGDLVAARWVAVGTHDGEFMGLDATERQATFGGMTFLRFEQDRIAEGWTQLDALTLMRAIQALPEAVRA